MPTVYLVSGSCRGIGFGLVTALSKRPDVIIYAGVRDLSDIDDLQRLASTCPDVVRIVQLVVTSIEHHRIAAQRITEEVGKLDVVIANAGARFSVLLPPPTFISWLPFSYYSMSLKWIRNWRVYGPRERDAAPPNPLTHRSQHARPTHSLPNCAPLDEEERRPQRP
jgi:NAD(P)-dependent dehydrogenase (short-subunit alcohol dehydrogenase family)